MELLIQKALVAAQEARISGKEVTPFLLSWLARESLGESLEANIALIKNNARLGAQIAVFMAQNRN
jgi:pseudouridine-5'-phosphate glycosidase